MNNNNYNSDNYSFSGDETVSWLEKAHRRANQHNDESLSSSGVSNMSFHFDPVNYQEPITSIQSGTPLNNSIAIRPDPPSSTQIHHYTHQRHNSLPLTPNQPVLSTTTYTTTNFVSPPPSTAPAALPSPAPAKSSAVSVAKKPPPPTKKKSKYPIFKSPIQPKIKDVPGYIQLNKDTKVFAITSRSGGTMTANASCKSTDSSSEDVFEARRKRRAKKKKTKVATKKAAAAKKAAPKKAATAKKATATKKAAATKKAEAVAKKAETIAKKEAAAVAKKQQQQRRKG